MEKENDDHCVMEPNQNITESSRRDTSLRLHPVEMDLQHMRRPTSSLQRSQFLQHHCPDSPCSSGGVH
ncbi:uncharacterized protein LOC125500070 [Athalia rosae]|uniref:uncharacterized protein LOC125500070 n=1 Tax=Athalia rosae TaxID=37344 RepID=UPI0020334088|nr:uncharacterized protein LOC125500070 [Athalia rosae]XP_048507304.1 uncharacterized protein LOC125500070 [Athalia rosae]